MLFILSLNFTDQGIRGIKDASKRAQAARDLVKKVGVELKRVYLTSGDSDLLAMVETVDGDNVAKFALALGAHPRCARLTESVGARRARQRAYPDLPRLADGRVPEAGRRAAVTRRATAALFPSSRVIGGRLFKSRHKDQ